jgi:polyhydroxybutyrate depolymerase
MQSSGSQRAWSGRRRLAAAVVVALGAAGIVTGIIHHARRPPTTATTAVVKAVHQNAGDLPAPTSADLPPVLPAVPAGWTAYVDRLSVGKVIRYYVVEQPVRITARSLPVLLVLSGRHMTPAATAARSAFPNVVGQAVLVFPAGYGLSWNAGFCCGIAHQMGVNDVAFLAAVVHAVLGSESHVSSSQVYLAGFSNGGRMAYRMLCADPGLFAGVASVEAVDVYSCKRTEPVPLIEVASTGDRLLTIPANGRPKMIARHTEPTVAASVAHWRGLEGCTATRSMTTTAHLTETTWARCNARGKVALAVYAGGSHTWPQGGRGTPPANRVIWSFFRSLR